MTTRAPTAIVYPDSDGMPLPDGEYQAPLYRKLVLTLELHFQDAPGVRVNGDTFIYYIEDNPHRSVSPDCYVVFGLSEDAQESIKRNNTYLLWEVGKPPDFVLEIASESTARVDLGRKRDLYADLGVSEYWRYDETGGEFYGEPLVGERLIGERYIRIDMLQSSDGASWVHSDVLNLDLWWVDGELRFWNPIADRWLLSPEEQMQGRLAAEARAEFAEARAEEERSSRLEAQHRIAALEAELRRLRGE